MCWNHPETILPTPTPRPRKHCLSKIQSLGPKKGWGSLLYSTVSHLSIFWSKNKNFPWLLIPAWPDFVGPKDTNQEDPCWGPTLESKWQSPTLGTHCELDHENHFCQSMEIPKRYFVPEFPLGWTVWLLQLPSATSSFYLPPMLMIYSRVPMLWLYPLRYAQFQISEFHYFPPGPWS